MEIFNPAWKFNSVYRVKISFRLNSKLFLKVTLQLHVKISTWYAELKLQLGLAGMNISNFLYNRNFFPNRNENLILRTCEFLAYFSKKIKMETPQARFKWTYDKLTNLIKYLQEFKSSMEFRKCNSNEDNVKLYENVRKRLNRYI